MVQSPLNGLSVKTTNAPATHPHYPRLPPCKDCAGSKLTGSSDERPWASALLFRARCSASADAHTSSSSAAARPAARGSAITSAVRVSPACAGAAAPRCPASLPPGSVAAGALPTPAAAASAAPTTRPSGKRATRAAPPLAAPAGCSRRQSPVTAALAAPDAATAASAANAAAVAAAAAADTAAWCAPRSQPHAGWLFASPDAPGSPAAVLLRAVALAAPGAAGAPPGGNGGAAAAAASRDGWPCGAGPTPVLRRGQPCT